MPLGRGPATEDKELGTNQRHGMVVTTAGPGTMDRDAGPLSRYWNGRSSDQLEAGVGLDIKNSNLPRLSR